VNTVSKILVRAVLVASNTDSPVIAASVHGQSSGGGGVDALKKSSEMPQLLGGLLM
jgi:phosphoribosylcarboxyaminoimidazole (NCAIR) mutase